MMGGLALKPVDTLRRAVDAAMDSVDPRRVHREFLERCSVPASPTSGGRLFGICVGKCAVKSALGVFDACGGRVHDLVVVDDLERDPALPSRARHYRAGHPLATAEGAENMQRITRCIASWELNPNDLILVSVSGGTSAMLALPRPPLDVHDLAEVSEVMLRSGLDVTTVNTIRRRVGKLHDGGLASLLQPARVWTLLQSDNAQGNLAAVGSGPTLHDSSSIPQEALDVIRAADRGLGDRLQVAIEHKRPASSGAGPVNVLTDLNTMAAALHRELSSLGLHVEAGPSSFAGSWTDLRTFFQRRLSSSERSGWTAIYTCGEITVSVPETASTEGGRCQQAALALAPLVVESGGGAAYCFATDGRDNLEGVRGAAIDYHNALRLTDEIDVEDTLLKACASPVLDAFDSLIHGERTGSNLCDIYILLVPPVSYSPGNVNN